MSSRGGSYRATIGGLLAVVGVCGVGFAALASPSPFWVAVTVSLNLGLLVLAGIGAAYHREPRRRAFWGGFLLAGLAYLIASRTHWLGSSGKSEELLTTAALDIAHAQLDARNTAAATTPTGVGMLWSGAAGMMGSSMMMSGGMPGGTMLGLAGTGMYGGGGMPGGGMGAPPPPANQVPTRWAMWVKPEPNYTTAPVGSVWGWTVSYSFLRVGHSLFGLLFGLAGGLVARQFRGGGQTEPTR